jgi:murein DD-endopeptidase MepM/ murein hydrolase activator NlpD
MPSAVSHRSDASSGLRHGAAAPLRPLALSRRGAIGLAGGATALVLWAGAATWFVATRDDLAQRVFVRETELQYRYEDRIAALQTELERSVTQNMVERNGVAARLDKVARRQAEIETRQVWLSKLAERFPSEGRREPAIATAKPAPLPEPFALRLRDGTAQDEASSAETERPVPRDRLSRIEGALDEVAAAELRVVEDARRQAQSRLARVRGAMSAAGFEAAASPAKGLGGPLVPFPQISPTGIYGPLAAELEATVEELDRTVAAARSLPFGRPLTGELEPTSPFGYRLDPFTRSAALHTGTDFRAETGAAVRATAGGKVTVADYTGGYGNMVEIDHGGGYVTRYGHLQAFSVAAGERVEAGETIGRVGSTGRSTGSHLHYETRINGEAVNPVRFLEAGTQLAGIMGDLR